MLSRVHQPEDARGAAEGRDDASLPRASLQFRLKAWREFQRALDPLAPPKPLRRPQRQ
jgi:hypothetical protein